MPRPENQALLPQDQKISYLAQQLSELLVQYPFNDSKKTALIAVKTQLDNGSLTAKDYFESDVVCEAIDALIGDNRNQYFLTSVFRIWWHQSHSFSKYEKIFLTLSSAVLLAGVILLYEILILYFEGKPRLEATGDAMKEYCTTGLSNRVSEICIFLEEGMTAVFNLNEKPIEIPAYRGVVNNVGPVPGTAVQTIHSWFKPEGWIDFFTCMKNQTTLTMTGHAFHGSLRKAEMEARNGFPVFMNAFNLLLSSFEIPAFLGTFCIMLQEGGYSSILNPSGKPYGYFNGMELFGKSFERYATAFSGAYGALVILAFLTASVLLCKKALSKWEASAVPRNVLGVVTLYKKALSEERQQLGAASVRINEI